MRIIISPAKKMNMDLDSLPPEGMPQFLPQAEELLDTLRTMTRAELQALWCCNNAIAALNFERLQAMDLKNRLTPAILSYEGIQYRYMAPGVFEEEQLAYLNEHLRILSGFYGLLRPFDGVAPYRLEMQAKLSVSGYKNLYAFWGSRPAQALSSETDFILDLASKEYSRCVTGNLPAHTRILTCTFGENIGGKIVEKGTLCKMARGEMVRYLAENRILSAGADTEGIKDFRRLGYAYAKELSTAEHFVFLKSKNGHQPLA